MKKILALALLLVTMTASVCQAAITKSYDEKNSRAIIRTMDTKPATEIDPESLIIASMRKFYIFDSRGYDATIGRYKPVNYFTLAIMGNGAEKFEKDMVYTVNGTSYTLPMRVESKENNKKQTVQAAATHEFSAVANEPFMKALKDGKPISITMHMKAKKGLDVLKYTIEGKVLEEMGQVVLYDLYSDDNFLNIAKKASQKPMR